MGLPRKFADCVFVCPNNGITQKICRLCICVLINKHSFEPFVSFDHSWAARKYQVQTTLNEKKWVRLREREKKEKKKKGNTMQPLCLSAIPPQCSQQWRWGEGGGNKSVFSLKVSQARQNIYPLWLLNSGDLGSRDSSVVWMPDSWLKGCVWIPAGVAGVSNLAFYAQSTSAVISGWMELLKFLLQSQLSVLTLILVLIPPSQCYRSST